jgi:predicted metalloprotease with PDZ domain
MGHRSQMFAALVVVALLAGCTGQTDQTRRDESPTEKPEDLSERQLRYRVALDEKRDETLVIQMAFVGDESGETTIAVPHTDQDGDENRAPGLAATSESASVSGPDDEGLYTVEHPPNTEVRLTYRVRGVPDPTHATEQYGPFVRPDGLYFEGSTIFAYPREMHPGLERPIRIDWRSLPKDWTIIGGEDRADRLQQRDTALGVIQKSMFLAGNIETVVHSSEGTSITLALLGKLPAPLTDFADEVVALIRAQQTFWKASEAPPYLIALYAPEDCCWSTGSTKYHGLAGLLAHDEPETTTRQLVRLVAHQHLHRWIPGEMGTPRPFNAYAWFAEGFTEYYARRFKVQTGFQDFETYIEQINELLARYHTSPVRRATRTQVNSGFKRNPNLTQIAYQRGELLATKWNAEIVEATDGEHSLDDVMQRLVEKREADDQFYFSDETFAETVHDFAPEVEVVPVIEKHIGKGVPVELGPDALGPCARFIAGSGETPPKFALSDRADEIEECLLGR